MCIRDRLCKAQVVPTSHCSWTSHFPKSIVKGVLTNIARFKRKSEWKYVFSPSWHSWAPQNTPIQLNCEPNHPLGHIYIYITGPVFHFLLFAVICIASYRIQCIMHTTEHSHSTHRARTVHTQCTL